MIARVQKTMAKRAEGEKGFTLIELLVVIIIIGILAAIAIPAFLNQRQKGWVSQVQSDLKNAAIAAESYAVDNNGSYDGLTEEKLKDNGFNETADVEVTVGTDLTQDHYSLNGTNTNLDDRSWTYDSTEGTITEDGETAP